MFLPYMLTLHDGSHRRSRHHPSFLPLRLVLPPYRPIYRPTLPLVIRGYVNRPFSTCKIDFVDRPGNRSGNVAVGFGIDNYNASPGGVLCRKQNTEHATLSLVTWEGVVPISSATTRVHPGVELV